MIRNDNKTMFVIPFIITLIMSLGGGGSAQKAKAEDTRKADYLYLEALREKSQDHHDAAYELLQKAYDLNSSDDDIAVELSTYIMLLWHGDSAKMSEAMAMLKGYTERNPDDLYMGARYAMFCEQSADCNSAVEIWKRLHYYYPDKVEVTYRYANALGRCAVDSGRNRAVALYDSIEISEGKSIPLSTQKIQLYMVDNDTAAVLSEVNRLLDSSPKSVDYNVFSGDIYAMFGDSIKAKGFYDNACEIDPSSGLAYYSRARFYKELGDSTAFNREVLKALQQKSLDVGTKLSIVRSYIQEMGNDSIQLAHVGSLFDNLIEQHPHEHDIHMLYADYLIVTQNYAKAAEQMELTLDLDPANEDGWGMLTSLYLQVDETDKALAAVNRSLRYYPENANQYLILGSIYDQKGEHEKAPAEYAHALQYADSTNTKMLSQIHGAMGDNLYARQLNDSAFVEYQQAILYNPENYLALNNCAYYLACENRDLDRALSMIETVIKAQPDNDTSLDTYAWVLFKRKDYAKAREIIDKTLEIIEERSAEVLEHAGDIYFMDGDPDGALGFWKEALELDPDNELLQRKVKNKAYYFK